MSARIWKWTLNLTDRQSLPMPEGAQILSIQVQGDTPQLWALVDDKAPIEDRKFATYGTGQPRVRNEPRRYVGTYQILGGDVVFHVFELTAKNKAPT